MKTQAELTELLDFIGEYATYLLGSGVHTSRVVRNARRIGASQSVDVRLTTFQRTSRFRTCRSVSNATPTSVR